MPLCLCVSGGCHARGGTDLSFSKPKGLNISAHAKHTLEDKILIVQEAENRAQATVDSQLEEITSYLSATTLADCVSGPSNGSGGRLWSRADGDEAIFPSHKLANFGSSDCPEHNSRYPQALQPIDHKEMK